MYKSNSLYVRQKVRNHVLKFYNKTNLKNDLKAVTYGRMSSLQGARKLVDGGNFLVSNYDVRKFIERLKINASKSTYSSDRTWSLYKELVAREILFIVANPLSKVKGTKTTKRRKRK